MAKDSTNNHEDALYHIINDSYNQVNSIVDVVPQESDGFLNHYFSGGICSHLMLEAESYRLLKINKNEIIGYSPEISFPVLDRLFFFTGFKPSVEAKIIDFGSYDNLEGKILNMPKIELKTKFLKNDDLALNNAIKVFSRGRNYIISHPVENFSLTFLEILEKYKENPTRYEDELVFWYESVKRFKNNWDEYDVMDTLFSYISYHYEKNPFDEAKINSFFKSLEKNKHLFFPFKMIIRQILDYDKEHDKMFPQVKIR